MLLKQTYYENERSCLSKCFIARRTDLFDKLTFTGLSVFEQILSSDEANAAKYISSTIKHYKLWNNQNFLKRKSSQGKTMMQYVATTKAIENLFSFLMFDWFDHEPSKDITYSLVLKSKQFSFATSEAGQELSLLEKLFDIIDDEIEKIYHDVCLRIIYQFLHEYFESNEGKFYPLVFRSSFGEFSSVQKVFNIKNQEYREKILQILVVFWNKNEDEKHAESKIMANLKSSDEEVANFFKLAFNLKDKENIKFVTNFEIFLNNSKKKYGDYSRVAIKPVVRLFYKIAEREGMNKTLEFIFEKFPYIEINSTILESFHDVQDFKTFNVYPIGSRSLSALVKDSYVVVKFCC